MRLLQNKKYRFIIAGSVNTCFAYLSTILLYYLLNSILNLFYIALMASVFNIVFSGMVQKYFVFSSKSILLAADAQVIIYYAAIAFSSSYLLDIMVNYIGISIWISQAFLIVVSAVLSYNYFNFLYKK